MNQQKVQDGSVAIIGMAGRFPQAANLDQFWRNLRDGVESISFFKDDELEWSWIDGAPPTDNPGFVKARGVLEKPEWFDEGFFNMTPREAEILDPQQRLFLECAWEAFENAGCDPETFAGMAGVFAGTGTNSYLLSNLLSHRPPTRQIGDTFKLLLAADKDFLTTRVSYKFNLRGPSVNVQTACSTSLMAVCLACQSLLANQCDLALAGGASVTFPQRKGQLHQEGAIVSSDGHCRPFDEAASGTTFSDGVGVVVLKRLSDALANGDRICAVIRGVALNNDGARKVGYTAPSVDGQAEVISLAHANAGVDPSTISYVEAHGTGTPLGDPIEFAGLAKAFGPRSGDKPTCAIGSVKGNIGHTDVASGIAGLLKTVLALQHRQIPPLLHYASSNKQIDWASSPFYPATALQDWACERGPRRAGVSAFGIGGTNAHVVLEEAPAPIPSTPAKPWQLVPLSARSPEALEAATRALAEHLKANPDLNFADVAFTLQSGRKAFACRRAVVCRDLAEAVETLSSADTARLPVFNPGKKRPAVAFLFPGQGAQQVDMARELYETEPVFREQLDRACLIARPMLGMDLRTLLFPEAEKREAAAIQLAQTRYTQPALFVVEHALARWWMHQGVKPQGMIGHSVGEYVAACLAEVFTVEDALRLVVERGRLMQAQAPGVMLAVRMDEKSLSEVLPRGLSIAAVNAPELCVVGGPADAIALFEKELASRGVGGRRLVTSHAFHSAMMDPMLPEFLEIARRTPMQAPRIPWVSNVTGKWITQDEATSPEYWTRHVRATVRFADCLGQLAEQRLRVLVEVGPGQTLCTLSRQHPAIAEDEDMVVLASLSAPGGKESDRVVVLKSLGRLWTAGVKIAWPAPVPPERRQRVALPTYPFERKRHWIAPALPEEFPPATSHDSRSFTPDEAPAKPIVLTVKTPTLRPADTRGAEPCSSDAAVCASSFTELRTLLQDLSGVDLSRADPSATFQQLGFDSLFLTQASLAVQNRFKKRVTLRQMLDQFPSMKTLSEHLDGGSSGPKTSGEVMSSAPAGSASSVEAATLVPLTAEQHEVWFAAQLSVGASNAYNESSTLRLRGALDVSAFHCALRRLVARHEALRATFSPAGDHQRISSTMDVELPLIDCTHLKGREQEAEVDAIVRREIGGVFDLTNGPLVRARLIRLAPEDHLFVLAIHHLVSDGWSHSVLLRDLGAIYSAERRDRSENLRPADRFSDYARSHAGRRQTPEFLEDEAYWVSQFAEPAPLLDLPSDRPRPAVRTHAGASITGTLPKEIMYAVEKACEGRGCTTFSMMLAAFGLLLHRLTAQHDLVIGVPAATQVLAGHKDLVGHCANLLPVRSRITDEMPFSDYVEATRIKLIEALEHWRYPLGDLVRKLDLPRSPNRVTLANVVFNSTLTRDVFKFDGLKVGAGAHPKVFVNFDLAFNLDAAEDDGLVYNLYYSTELFDEATMRRLVSNYQTLLLAIAENPARPVSRMPLLSDAERRKILVEWNSAKLPYAKERCVHDLFAEQVKKQPDATAIIAGEDRITYRQLDRWAERVARRLRAEGVGPEKRVGVFIHRTPALIAAMLGVLKAGGGYVPLDPAYPPERLAMIVEDSCMTVLLTSERLAPQAKGGNAAVILVEDIGEGAGEAFAPLAPAPGTSSRNVAYVLYTSGSTGRPKGVEIEHHSVAALVAWAQATYEPGDFDGMLAATSVCFDLSTFEIFVPLCTGGKLILTESILLIGDVPAAEEITLINTVPSAIADLLGAGRIPEKVRVINLAGEALKQELVEEIHRKTRVKRVYDLYGPTETTVYSTFTLRVPGGRATIGRPLANEQVYILDPWMQPVPVGVPGELYIGGAGLARGYLNRPDLTAERFVENPFETGTRLYRTGDRARFLEGGVIEYLGRMDHQLKVRGFRIEPGEIEAALRQHPAVADAVVVVRADNGGDQRIVGYVVPRGSQAPEPKALRSHLQRSLPVYMIPAAFAVLEKFPLTPNGKVDRRALPAPDLSRSEGDRIYVAPRTPTEEVLAEIWREVLGVDRIGVDESFFDSGGHSLMATQVLSRVREAFQVELSLRRFFAAPVIADQAAAIDEVLFEEIKNMPVESIPETVEPARKYL